MFELTKDNKGLYTNSKHVYKLSPSILGATIKFMKEITVGNTVFLFIHQHGPAAM